MKQSQGLIDVESILRGLKDFQRHTVDYIFSRMYEDADYTRRFLLADEVGLGKTLVARGLIAKAVEHLYREKRVKRIDVVYVCSNLDIARQNINRLNVTATEEFALASRITLLPEQIADLKGRRLNFVSFTPSTSFDLKSALGITRERALLYCLLKTRWSLKGSGPRNLLQGYTQRDAFWRAVDGVKQEDVDSEISQAFLLALDRVCEEERKLGYETLKSVFLGLCDRFSRASEVTDADRERQKEVIGKLRTLLAETCLEALEPDLIILDEFQRFKHLLSGDDEPSLLARRLFNFADAHSQARVLLLSATPYKMYTLAHESQGEDHFEDFIRTVAFLQDDQERTSRFQTLLQDFRGELFHLADGGASRVLDLKQRIESELRWVMVRTERLAATADRDGMLAEVPPVGLTPTVEDLRTYVALGEVASQVGAGDVMELWKSAPYLLSFMEDYDLKRRFRDALGESGAKNALKKALIDAPRLLVPWPEVRRYGQVDSLNARLSRLFHDTLDVGAWKLLWLPPGLPYYQLRGPYSDPALSTFTKRLVFSSWRVVPKAISTLVSYEAERRIFQGLGKAPSNSPSARKRLPRLLRFALSDGRLTGMPLFLLIYPSFTLARMGDLIHDVFRRRADGASISAEQIVEYIAERIEDLVSMSRIPSRTVGQVDDRWYWLFPMILDAKAEGIPEEASHWMWSKDLSSRWAATGSMPAEEHSNRWSDHVESARELLDLFEEGRLALGPPPADLAVVLAKTCIASPAVCAFRSLSAATGDPTYVKSPEARIGAAQVAWSILRLFNLPESTALLRGLNSAEPYWLRVLDYCQDGCLQAVLDEYVHLLVESEGLSDKPPSELAAGLSQAIRDALGLRTSSLAVDEIIVGGSSRKVNISSNDMRTRFAVRFGQGKERAEDGTEPTREDQVRRAFNSPFWPFVLATTSVGQEGLDFHPYCHAVVHWNLPSNPVDLEQREGRVHRYKGHAVRKNLALKYGRETLRTGEGDVWGKMFQIARKERSGTQGDIVPYWVFSTDGGFKVERYVYASPLSRESAQIDDLRKSLAVYRMVFGQTRQADMLKYLLNNLSPDKIEELSEALKIDLSPPQR